MQIPANWQDVLKKIHVVYPQAIIAGGALRDLLHGKPVKDVDIFIPVLEWHDKTDLEGSQDLAWLVHEILNTLFPVEENEYIPSVSLKLASMYGRCLGMGRDVKAVYSVVVQDTIYEIIFSKQTPEQYARIESTIEQFDLNLCQIGYDGLYVFSTPAFEQALTDKIIRVMNVNRRDRQKKRIARILAKYPEYTAEETSGEAHGNEFDILNIIRD